MKEKLQVVQRMEELADNIKRTEENRMKGIIDLADVQESPAAVTAFYDRFRGKIADIETEVRQEPQSRDKLSEIYQLLKRKCWEVGLCGNQ